MIINDDIIHWAETYDGPPFHALLCDPPYHLVEIVKRFGKEGSVPAQYGKDGAFQRASRGFMGRTWDGLDENGQGIAFRPETWAALARHLHPGAFGMAFASTKGYHRMACAIEDAGLIIHPMIVYAFGSGFPKATRIDTQVDRRAGVERKVVGRKKHQPKFDAKGHGYREKDNGFNSKERKSFDLTEPATDLAAAWEGHRYGGQVLKPALEPICVFQKPYQGAPVDCITQTGAGALNIEGGRVGANGGGWNGLGHTHDETQWRLNNPDGMQRDPGGRWPSNFILDEHAAAMLDAQSGTSTSKRSQRGNVKIFSDGTKGTEGWTGASTERGHNDSGGASRYFQQCNWAYEVEEQIAAADPVRYCAKAGKTEREMGLDPDQIRLLSELYGEESDLFEEDTIDDGREKSIDNPYQRGETTRRNVHPTVKPISLSFYLAKLLLPPMRYATRRLLIPFAGVASECLGAEFAGWEEYIGVELDALHCRIAEARIRWWQTMRRQTLSSDPGAILRAHGATNKVKPELLDGQLTLF